MLNWVISLSAILAFLHPYKNIFNISKAGVFLFLLVLVVGRISLNKCKYNRFVAMGNTLVLGSFIVFLFSFSDQKYSNTLYIVAIGQSMNFVALLLNGGRMPVEKKALTRRGCKLLPNNPLHFIENECSRMIILDDRIYIPAFSHKIVSVGDILTDIGLITTAVNLYIF